MLSYDFDAAYTIQSTTRRTNPRHPRPPSNHVRPYLAIVALAVVALLLFPAGSRANLVEEVPLTHWSYQALDRLVAAGLVDPVTHPIPPTLPLTRYQMASAASEAITNALSLAIGAEVDGEAIQGLIPQARTILERLDYLIDGAQDYLIDGARAALEKAGGQSSPARPLLRDYTAAYVERARAGHGQGVNGRQGAPTLTPSPEVIIDDLRRLAHEFAPDIGRLGGFASVGHPTFEEVESQLGGEAGLPPDVAANGSTGSRGVSLDAIIATLESGRGGDVSRRSVGVPLSGVDPVSDQVVSGRREGASGSGSSHRRGPSAEYGFDVLGLTMTTSLSVDEKEFGTTTVPAARLQASVPLPGDRGAIEAGYSFVDLDRLREISATSVGASGRPSERGSMEKEGRARFHVTGVAPLGEAVSIRVGYELRAADESATNLESVLGAGFEYRLGERGNVTADLRWSKDEGDGHGEAGVGFGYRLGENASLVATYSMITFESAKEAVASGLGEAELEVRF